MTELEETENNTVPKDSTDFSYEMEMPSIRGKLKQNAEDFRVTEKLKFELNGEGQHLCLLVQKKLLNTQDAVGILSRFFNVPPRAIGYLGLKDKVAVTQQWFSVDLASSKIDTNSIEKHCDNFSNVFPELLEKSLKSASKKKSKNHTQKNAEARGDDQYDSASQSELPKKHPAEMKILEISRNRKKFKIGQLSGNSFELVLRDISNITEGSGKRTLSPEIKSDLERKLEHIKEKGFPNYFGEQRFGRDNHNIELLKKNINTDLNKRRGLRSRVISTYRSLAFNRYLSERIANNTARCYVEGDVLQFSDGNSVFTNSNSDGKQDSSERIQQRIDAGEVVVSGPLVGIDESLAQGESLVFEESIARKFRTYAPVLERYQVKAARRSLFAKVNNLTWHFSGQDLFLKFDLSAGSFATSLIREMANYRLNKNPISGKEK